MLLFYCSSEIFIPLKPQTVIPHHDFLVWSRPFIQVHEGHDQVCVKCQGIKNTGITRNYYCHVCMVIC